MLHRLQTTSPPAQQVIAVELRRLLLLPLEDLLAVVRGSSTRRSRHHFRGGEGLKQILLRYVRLDNPQRPQAALKGRTPIETLKDWHRERPELFRKPPNNHPGCST